MTQTISEKLQAMSNRDGGSEQSLDVMIHGINGQLVALRQELDEQYGQARLLQEKGAEEEEYAGLLTRVNEIRAAIGKLESQWRGAVVEESKRDEEGYALWDQEETTLTQLIMEFGASEYLYVVPPEMAGLKLNMHSNIPIPRESWEDVLEIILSHSGIGVKKINAYARQLYPLKQDPSVIPHMASSPEDLAWLADHTRLFYVFAPPVEQVKSALQFFERFADAKQTFIYQVGPKIAIVSSKTEIQKLLNLYQTVWEDAQGKVSRVVPVTKMAVKEMEKILTSFFGESMERNRPPFAKVDQEGLNVFALPQGNALILIGQEEIVDRAEQVVKQTEEQLQDPAEMTIYLYSCRHSNPDDLAKVLDKVYASLLTSATEGQKETEINYASQGAQFKTPPDGYAPTPPHK